MLSSVVFVLMLVFIFMIETDKRMTYQQIWTNLSVGRSQVHKILHEHLAVRKLCTRRIPNKLIKTQKVRHINWCLEMIQRFASGDSNAVTTYVQALLKDASPVHRALVQRRLGHPSRSLHL
ncbi:hypothetical protein EVAR_23504_1 [Eumeta japonica]|uniref:Mariner Mos1 transposase n=1 Tax=Eumeta variegata TaxID=151549 RepID=A0A4C1W1U2_EUMVA|nr:hypothetical protein EVAR_23504_1 [Eumeta japonica]